MPELTVSMPAYDTEKYVGEAIRSVLRQTGADFELMVVDDASTDNTSKVALSFQHKDRRVKVIKNEVNSGISYCHNRVIQESDSRFIAHVDSDDLVLPNAFQRMLAALKSDARIGQAHCYFFPVNENGKTTREAFRARRRHFLKHRPPDMDYKRELLVRGTVTNHLRTYRREVFHDLGYFNESLAYAEDYEMALRILDKYKIKLVPEFLYCFRKHENSTTKRLELKSLGLFLLRLRICRELLKDNKVSFLRNGEYSLNQLMVESLYETVLAPKFRKRLRQLPQVVRRRAISSPETESETCAAPSPAHRISSPRSHKRFGPQ